MRTGVGRLEGGGGEGERERNCVSKKAQARVRSRMAESEYWILLTHSLGSLL
jgi:hypothetical protein